MELMSKAESELAAEMLAGKEPLTVAMALRLAETMYWKHTKESDYGKD